MEKGTFLLCGEHLKSYCLPLVVDGRHPYHRELNLTSRWAGPAQSEVSLEELPVSHFCPIVQYRLSWPSKLMLEEQ